MEAGEHANEESRMMARGEVSPFQLVRAERDSAWKRLRRNRVTFISALALTLIVIAAIAGPFIYRLNPAAPDFSAINSGPSPQHLLGADNLGRDTLARLLQGLRVSLLVALIVESLNVVVGATIGLFAGYFGGWVDNVLSRLADMLFAFPGLLLAILVSAIWGQWVTEHFGSLGRLLLVASALSLVSWPLMTRLVRSEGLSIREREYVLAARSLGAGDRRILLRYILPNLTGIIITAATLDVVGVIINESVLSLLGLGTQPPMSSIGRMINDAVKFFSQSQFQVFVPAAMLMVLVVVFSFIGDGIRDVLDPYNQD